jgi:hypothetical protein
MYKTDILLTGYRFYCYLNRFAKLIAYYKMETYAN